MASDLYRRTEAGNAAWQRQDPGVPAEYRRLLGLIEGDTHPDHLRGRLAELFGRPDAQPPGHAGRSWTAAGSGVGRGAELDFTGNFKRGDLVR